MEGCYVKDDKTIDIWGLENSYIVRSFSEQEYLNINFDPGGRSLMIAAKTGQIQKWNTNFNLHPFKKNGGIASNLD